ncbi:unnamed protein product [Pylaiella littoralis]
MSVRSPAGMVRSPPGKARASPSSKGGAVDGGCMIGRKILKRLGDTVVNGHVKGYNPPSNGNAESWTLCYENPHSDEDSDEDEEVCRPELDKRLNLQAVKEREFPPAAAKKGRGRPRKDGSSPGNSLKQSRKSPAGNKKRMSSSSSSLASLSPIPRPPQKKVKKGAASGVITLRGDDGDLRKRVAKEFNEGVFTGEVVEVKETGARGTLWKIGYEDGDMEDLNKEEMQKYMTLYKLLCDRFTLAKGRGVTAEDKAKEGLAEDDDDDDLDDLDDGDGEPNRSQSKKKGKSKKGGVCAQEKQVGAGVRKFFERYDEEFDGQVSKYLPPESDDEHGDLWLIKYEDGDEEHYDSGELAGAKALYKKRYALVKKKIPFDSSNPNKKENKIILYGESPVGARGVFSTIKGYRHFKNKTS